MTASTPIPDWDRLLRRVAGWFTVERLTPDREAELGDFFKKAYRDQPLAKLFQDDDVIQQRFHWLNERNPAPFDGRLPAWICLQKGRIVGHMGALAAEVVARVEVIPICWGRDLIVAPEARRLGAGPFLVMTAVRDAQRPFLVAGLNDDAYSLYRQLGFHDGGTIPLYLKVRDTARLLETMRWPAFRRRAVSGRVAAAQLLPNRPRQRGRSLAVTALERFDGEFDRWWASVEPAFPCVVRRTAATLAWRYQDHPSHNYHCFAARAGQSLCGVIVVRHGRSRGLPAAFISEVLAHPQDRRALDTLLGHASEFLCSSGPEMPVFIRCSALHRSFEQALTRAGFLRAPSPLRWMLIHPGGLLSLGALAERKRWLLTAGDSDLDML